LTLELQRRHAGRLCRHKGRSPEPDLHRCPGRVHNGTRCEVGVSSALAAPQNRWSVLEAVGLTRCSAPWTHKTIRPSNSRKVVTTRSLVGEHTLEFQQSRQSSFWRWFADRSKMLRHKSIMTSGIL
jgi:hypothetical protein